MDDSAFLHVAASKQAAICVRGALEQIGRAERVVGTDVPQDGPIQDVDEGGLALAAWWREIDCGVHSIPENAFDDRAVWTEIRNSELPIMVWHGPHAQERILALRACWHLREAANRVYEVAIPESKSRRPAPFYDSVALGGLNDHAAAWARRTPVMDVRERAARWEAMRDKPGTWLRSVAGDAVIEKPVTAHDAALLERCREHADAKLVVASVLAENAVGFSVLCWRVRELVRQGVLEGHGHDAELALPAEIRIRG